MNNVIKHQLAIATVMEQFARRNIYVWPSEHGGSVRLRTKGGKHSIRVLSRFSGDWQLDDWQKEISDDSYDVTVLVDFTQPSPLLFIMPGDWYRQDIEAHSNRPGHHAILHQRVLQWLYDWSVMEQT